MKKTAISLLLAVAMVFSLVLVAAPVAQAAEHTAHCVCGGNAAGTSVAAANHTCDTNVTWTKWDNATAVPTEAGNYYLDVDVTIDARAEVKADAKVVLCLNGHTVTCTSNAVYKLLAKSTLTIADCVGTGVMTGAGKNGGVVYNEVDATMNIYGGTWKAPATGKASGGCIFWMGGELNIYGGTLIGGEMDDRGGVLNLAGSAAGVVCNMYGGTIKGGSTKLKESDGKGGGNIRIGGNNSGANTSIMNIYGGTIEGGKSAGIGGNIFIQQPNNVLNIYGGTIKDGQATSAGPDIYAMDGAKVNIVKANVGLTIVKGRDSTNATAVEKGTEKTKVEYANKDSSIKVTVKNNVYTVAAAGASGGSNPSTGDSANLVVMGLGLVLGVAGMACLLPKKQKV